MDIDAWLKELRVPREAYRVVALLPLVYVAWADGKIQKSERDVILRIAREQGLLDHGGGDALDRWCDRLVMYGLAMVDAERRRRAAPGDAA